MWRLLQDDGASAAGGLAGDEMLATRVGALASPPVLRLYTYRPHAALVGRFQDVRQEVCVDWCIENDIDIGRRPTGGGAIIMGPDQLGVALALPRRSEGFDGGARARMARFSDGIVRGLSALGVAAEFQGKNDLGVRGRKIAGLGLHRAPSGSLLFHASILVDLDVALMSRVLRLPLPAETDADRDAIALRTTTVRTEAGSRVPMDAVRHEIACGFAVAFGVDLESSECDSEERDLAALLEQEKYRRDAWVWQRTAVPDATGAARTKTGGGDLEVRVRLAGGMIKAVAIEGDFFATDAAVTAVESGLRWHPTKTDAIRHTVRSLWTESRDATVLADELATAVLRAIANAHHAVDPYGCFVTPETARG
ncbi:MAG: hypothetical protein CMJ83_15740 [Planctomycetes bacterium]|nr:hypothetical protein [Planctomycetota bacterium]